MKIGVDMDEVIADTLPEYINFLNDTEKLGLTRDRFTRYYTWDTWDGSDTEKVALFDRYYKSEYFYKVKPIAGALEGLQKLSENHELYIITSRPDEVAQPTELWLKKYYPNLFSGVYYANYRLNRKKSDICKTLEVQLMIEDSLEYALNCAENDIDTILLKFPWNNRELSHPRINRVDSWNEVPSAIERYSATIN
jgi:5'(3')-deoxyribonucleotidase